MRQRGVRAGGRSVPVGLACLVLGVLGAGHAARADLVFSNIPPDNSVYFLAYSLIDADLATPFTVSGPDDYGFTGAEVAVTWSTFMRPSSVTLTVLLMADDAGLPGSVLESIDLVLDDDLPVFEIVGVESLLRPELKAGSTYWLGLSAPRGAFNGAWFASTSLETGNMALRTNGGWSRSPGNIDGAFRIHGDPIGTGIAVPEPSALTGAVLGAVLLLGGAWWGRRRPSAGGAAEARGSTSPPG